jgi:pimeloyl-ACP methyl ester carboxylesterase
VPEVEALGHDVVPVTLPAGDDRAGWAEYADATETAIGDRANLIVVAQSLAGFTAPLVCARRRVDLLVLLNAMIPRPGETGNDWGSNTRRKEAERAYFAEVGLPPETADDEMAVYFHDVPPDVVAEADGHGLEQTMTPMGQPWPLDAWPDVPTRVLAGRDDRLFPVAFQRRVARERLGIEADEIDGGHMAALSHPHELAERLEAYRAGLEAPDPRA